MKTSVIRLCAVACLATVGLAHSASAETIYGIASQGPGQALITWDSSAPGNLLSSTFLSIPAGDAVLGIDFRPATGQLYALVTSPSSPGLRTIALSGVVSPVLPSVPPPVNGFSFGFDFNPVIDRVRAVSDVNKNTVYNPNDNSASAVTDLFFGPADPNFGVDPNVGGSAYTNNISGAAATQLYGIDTGLDILVTQANSAGTLATVGPLGVNFTSLGGFDISGTTGIAYATFTPAGSSQSVFYQINLATGLATALGQIGGGVVITAMSVAPAIPEPATCCLALTGLVAAVATRRRRS